MDVEEVQAEESVRVELHDEETGRLLREEYVPLRCLHAPQPLEALLAHVGVREARRELYTVRDINMRVLSAAQLAAISDVNSLLFVVKARASGTLVPAKRPAARAAGSGAAAKSRRGGAGGSDVIVLDGKEEDEEDAEDEDEGGAADVARSCGGGFSARKWSCMPDVSLLVTCALLSPALRCRLHACPALPRADVLHLHAPG
jgi:hypothetical protein